MTNIILRLLLYKTIFNKYGDKIHSRELAGYLQTIKSLHMVTQHDIEFNEFKSAMLLAHPDSLDIVNNIDPSGVSSEIATKLVQDWLIREWANKLALKAIDVTEGRASLVDIQEYWNSFTEDSNSKEDEFVTNNFEELWEVNRRDGGIEWFLPSLNKSIGGLRICDFGIIFARTNCISGDSKIRVRYHKDSNGARIYTMKKLHEMFNGKHHLKGIGHQVQSCTPEGRIYYNDIEHVTYSGKKEVYLVETIRGFKLKATLDHEFLLPDGNYKKLGLLSVGDNICSDRTEKFNRKKGGEKSGIWPGSPYKYRYVEGKYGPYHRAKIYRLYYDAYLNDLTLDEFLLKLSNGEAPSLKFSDQTMDIHHVDMNHDNNNKDNLTCLSHEEHLRLHTKAHDNGQSHFVDPDSIKAITFVGIEDCYDLGVAGENKNFRAEGIYIHNCGKTSFNCNQIAYILKNTKESVLYFNNEEAGGRVYFRIVEAYFGIDREKLGENLKKAETRFKEETQDRLKIFDRATISKYDIERVVKSVKPGIIIVDNLDKIKGFKGDRQDIMLGSIYTWAREIAKQYAPFIGVSQAADSASNKKWLDTGDMADSNTSKQKELDFLIGIGATTNIGEENIRYLSICKNKFNSFPNKITCRFDSKTSRFKEM